MLFGFIQRQNTKLRGLKSIGCGQCLLKRYLNELENASFIRTAAFNETKGKKYKLFDEYLIFYFKFIKPQLKVIKAGYAKNIFNEQILNIWNPWIGNPIDASIIKEFARKLNLLSSFQGLSVKKVLISLNGATQELQSSDYFDYIINKEDFFK